MNKQIKAKSFQTVSKHFLEFVQTQQFGGILLLACTVFSITLSNSAISERYMHFWHTSLQVIFSGTVFSKSIEFFINDGLMSIFFLLVGIEIKRELTDGELSTQQKAALPLAAAFGGMMIPAFIFYFFNKGTVAASGWGIPMATDIAFALGILALVGKKVPLALKVFLTALAVVDDLGAIVVIGLFYSSGIQFIYALMSLGIIVLLLGLNKLKVNYSSIYIALGFVLWFTIHRMGIHATLSGVLLAFTLPTHQKNEMPSVSGRVAHFLHIPVNFMIMPLFALANTCIAFGGELFEGAPSSLIVGILAGLFLGKPIGIVLFSFIAVKLKWAILPRGVDWNLLIGAGFLGGIGFTMSVFITLLAFSLPEMVNAAKITIVIASLLAGVVGFIWLKNFIKQNKRMKAPDTFLFVINPKAGGRSKDNLSELIEKKAKQFNVPYEIIFTIHAGHAFELASVIDEIKYKAIVAVGGDGTINEVGRGLINKPVALAIIPMGSGNGLARYSKIPLKSIKAIETVFTGKMVGMDVIKMNNNFSFNVSGVGFDAAVAHDFQHLHKRGFWGYFKLVLKQALNFKPVEISIDLHSAEGIKNIKEKVFLMVVANSNQFGNNAIIAPTADTSDGKFNLVIVKPFAWYKMPYYAAMMFANKFDKIKPVLNYESADCTIRSSTTTWHVDGEPVNLESPIEIKVLPLAIQIIVPQ